MVNPEVVSCELTSAYTQCMHNVHLVFSYAQNPLDAFPRSFPVDGEIANLLPTCY